MSKHITLISQYAFYPMHWEAFRLLCSEYDARGSVIALNQSQIPLVHVQLGRVDVDEARCEAFAPDIRIMPAQHRTFQKKWLHQQLDSLRPDAIWVQEEPTNRWLLEVLRHRWRNASPRIVCAVVENIFPVGWWRRLRMRRLWRRIDRLIATATPSLEGIRDAGMPPEIPADVLVAGAQAPPTSVRPRPLSLRSSDRDWIVGFAGRITEEKGWHILLDAIELLPPEFKVVLAGEGPQVDFLRCRLTSRTLDGRGEYVGLLPKTELWSFYRALDCLVAPHLTRPRWKEQFGGVLADGMAMGLPIIGTESGAIPEVLGPAGLIVPENDAHGLAHAIRKLHDAPELAKQLAENGRERFAAEFAIPVYARKIARALEIAPRHATRVAAA